MLAAVYWARAPRVVLPDRALCLPTFCHLLEAVNKTSSSSSLDPSHVQPCMPLNTVTLPPPYYRSYTLPVSNKGYIREVVLRHGNPGTTQARPAYTVLSRSRRFY